MRWLYSVESLKYDTASGRLEPGTYADKPGGGVYVRGEDEEKSLPTLTKVNILGPVCWDVFMDSKGVKHYREITKAEYSAYAVKGAAQPVEMVET